MNVKIRHGKLELKHLLNRHQGLERWRLEDCENQCYPLALSRILGITPLTREEDYG